MSKQNAGTELAKQNGDTDVALAEREQLLAELREAQEEEFEGERVQIPILKVAESLTREVQDENSDISPGHFVNSATGQSLGREVDFIVAYYQKGRMAVDRTTNRTYVAFTETIPERWADLVGESFVGTPFAEYTDAEEQYKARVNAKEIQWGKGPLISTTYNYTGLVLVQERDELDQPVEDSFELQPVRLSLYRARKQGHDKIRQLKAMSLRPPKMFWDRVFHLTTQRKDFASGPAHLVIPTLTRPTTEDEKQIATELAIAVRAGRVQDNSDDALKGERVEPEAKGGLAV
jgi:hypothetical protein